MKQYDEFDSNSFYEYFIIGIVIETEEETYEAMKEKGEKQ